MINLFITFFFSTIVRFLINNYVIKQQGATELNIENIDLAAEVRFKETDLC